jgi:hypothetical protein
MYYKDTQNKLHDDMGGSAVYLLPAGCVAITDAEAAALQLAANPPPSVASIKAANLKKVDTDTDTIYDAAIGNRATEYSEAELQANTFKAAGYSGTAPAFVASWLANNAKGLMTAQQAADDIIAQANAWRGAAAAIRANRLLAKKNLTNDVATAMAQWNGFVAAIRSQLGL